MHTSKLTTFNQYLFLTILFLLPTLFLPLNSISIETLKIFLVLVSAVLLGGALVIQRIKKNNFFVTKNLLYVSVGTILLSGLLSSIFSNNFSISFIGRQINFSSFMSLVLLFALSYAIAQIFSTAQAKGKIFLTLQCAGMITILLQLCVIFLPFFPQLGFFVSHTINSIGNWFDLGLFSLFILLTSVLMLQYIPHSKFYKISGWIGFGLSLIMVALVNSMLIWIVGAIFSLIFVVLHAVRRNETTTIQSISYPALAVFVLSVLFLLIGGKAGVLLNSTFNFQYQEVRPTLTSTYSVVKDTFMHNPTLGVGVNRFETAWLKYRPAGINTSDYWDTDFKYGYSNILSIPVTQGIVGTLAWLFFLVMCLLYASKLMYNPHEQKSETFINKYALFGFLYFLVVLTVYTPSIVLIALFFMFFGLFLSSLNSMNLVAFKEVSLDKSPRISFVYILLLVLVLIGFIYAGYILVSQYSSRIIFERASQSFSATNDLNTAENEILKAQFIFNSDMYLKSLTQIGLLQINSIFQNSALSQDQAVEQFKVTLQKTVGYAQAAIAYDSQSYSNRLSLESIYKNLVSLEVPGSKDEALKTLDSIEELTPNNPSIHLERARILSASKEYDPAIDEISKALELKPNYVDAVFLLSQIQVEKGEIDQAVSSIQAALSVQKYNPNLQFQLGLLKYNQKKYGDAVISFENAVILSPYFGNAKYFLGLSYYQNKNVDAAVLQFKDLVQLYPDNQEVKTILNNLESGKNAFDGIKSPNDTPEARETLPVDDNTVSTTDTDKTTTEATSTKVAQ